jgi:Cu/Zn superoxide dismutase
MIYDMMVWMSRSLVATALAGLSTASCSASPVDSQALVASSNASDPSDGEIDPQDLATFEYANERYQRAYGIRLPEARLVPRSGSSVSGILKLHPTTDRGLKIIGLVRGLQSGRTHGVALHESGSCASADARSAGDPYAPEARASVRMEGSDLSHGGLGNLTADATGTVRRVRLVLPGISIEQVLNRTVIIYRDALGEALRGTAQPSPRWGCGEILIPPARTALEPRE